MRLAPLFAFALAPAVAAAEPALDFDWTARIPRRAMMARFAAHPMVIHAPAALDVGPVPGGPDFVLAVDGDGSIRATDWRDPNQNATGLQWIEEQYHSVMPDNVQFIVAYTSWRIDTIGAFYFPLANDVTGIGYEHEVTGAVFDDTGPSPLEGQLLMNSIDTFGQIGFAAWVFDQELGHRWGAFVRFDPGTGKPSDELLGRDLQHWSYFFETGNSPMEGNHWSPQADGSFVTDDTLAPPPPYSMLDLYLMGLAAPSEVTPSFVIEPATTPVPDGYGGTVTRASPPEDSGRTVRVVGSRRDVALSQILAIEGPRVPSSDASPKQFHVGFVLIVQPGEQWDRALLEKAEAHFETAVGSFATATRGRASLIVESHGSYPRRAEPGEPCPGGLAECDPARADACVTPLAGGSFTDGGAPLGLCAHSCATDADCGGGCCHPATDGHRYCFTVGCPPPPASTKPAASGATGCDLFAARTSTGTGAVALLALLAIARLHRRWRAR